MYNGEKDYPKTKDEWWALVDKYWNPLLVLMRTFLPTSDCLMWDEAARPDPKLDGTYSEGFSPGNESMLDEIMECKKHHNRDLIEYLQRTWRNAPDTPKLHALPGWYVLCDLLSEGDVLYEEEQP